MGLIERASLIGKISPPFDNLLATQLVDEFISMERRFIQRDWEPAELDGGQFAEITGRILYHLDSGTVNYGKEVRECIGYFENDKASHLLDRKSVSQIASVIKTIYKFRSQRGAVHISVAYSPNQMDSKYLIEAVRWCMNELLRIFATGDREEVAKIIRELLQFDVPCVAVFENVILVQRTGLKPEEEILILLHYAGETGLSRSEIGKYSMLAPSSATTALKRLSSPATRQICKINSGNYRLTDLGSRRIRLELTDKLLMQ